jgi:hypothetical protein
MGGSSPDTGLIDGTEGQQAGPLLATGAAIWMTNVIVFGLWYWDLDRGGPAARACGERQHTDFLYPQMVNPELATPAWEPQFIDYLYVSFTNATAFSPTDVMPLTRWAKLLMLVQSAISLATVVLVCPSGQHPEVVAAAAVGADLGTRAWAHRRTTANWPGRRRHVVARDVMSAARATR